MSLRKLQEDAWTEAKARAVPKTSHNERYLKFQEKYKNDFAWLINDLFIWDEGGGPTKYQNEILGGFQDNPRQSVRGPHGLGKSAIAAWCTVGYGLSRDGKDWKAITTASVWRQLTKYLWPEIHKWSRRVNWKIVGRKPFDYKYEMQTLQLKLNTGAAFAVASDDHTSIEGAHADYLFYIFDESKSIIDATFDAAEGAFSGAGFGVDREAWGLAISTPGPPLGRFYDIHRQAPGLDDWKVKHVKLEESIEAGRITRDWADKRKLQWGEGSALYKNRVLGEFAASDEDGVIPLEWLELSNQRWDLWQDRVKKDKKALGKLNALGADIGSGSENSNSSIIAKMYDNRNIDNLFEQGRGGVDFATMQVSNRLGGYLGRNQQASAFIDVIGIGLGAYQRLKEQKYKNAYAFNSAERTKYRDMNDEFGFINKRAAGWWILREALNPDNHMDIALPRDVKLIGELTAPKYTVRAGGMIQVESKDDIIDRIGRSTDRADAVVYCVSGEALAKLAPTQVYVVGKGDVEYSNDG